MAVKRKITHELIRLVAQIGGAVALTIVFVGFGVVIWKGPWEISRQQQQLDLLGWGMLAAAFLVLIALVAITEITLNFKANRTGVEASVDQDDDKTKTTVKVETTK